MIRVLIVDDSLFIRTILRDLLKDCQDIEVIGTAVNGIDALAKIADLKPDVITLDIEMPRMGGLEVLEALRERGSGPKVIVLSTLTSRHADMTHRALRLGADDFMLKPRDVPNVRGIERELIQKIRNLVALPTVVRTPAARRSEADAVVLIGSSAGGPPMLDALLSALPPDLPAAVVVTQHMPEGFTASLAERLNRVSPLPVKETENGEILQTGSVVVSKAGHHTVVSGILAGAGRAHGRVVHSNAPPLHAVRPAVDTTFASAARVFGPRTVSVILSGMGSDGGEGTLAVKAAGGTTMVCAEEDCLVYGMARSALARNCVDRVVPLAHLAREIAQAVSRL
ncbi:chemotaxis-specific protein-glutamate methyltransferase CheB [Methanoculleus sp. Wushi-C6]|uniref:Protein-glutamate methylesterase/protein-glutamine glutaminase n=1 Tax=Methanoculleus caldifontis TaxID=2651577 RepID=A0ABU3X2P8_9EURY|nr:chemotaxis-specific protein-glutamate methyltransferase CheB [Methanoculleus sp. Wushi-C6]MDV2482335.1 chemotaxis-specific protein-glutamate methyltransferase CheB [Methanoculleus sp. Wushi-C6]